MLVGQAWDVAEEADVVGSEVAWSERTTFSQMEAKTSLVHCTSSEYLSHCSVNKESVVHVCF